MPEPTYSIVIPCFQDEGSLDAIFERVGGVMDRLDGAAELILVDDGSTDATGPRAIELARGFRHPVAVVRLLRNFGQHAAVTAGMARARGAVVVTLDSDLQYPPEQIPDLIAALDGEHPVASGVRRERRDPIGRRLVTGLLTRWIGRRTGQRLEDVGSMFRAYDRSVVDRLLEFTEHRRFLPALVAWLGVPVREIPIDHHARKGRSRYRLSSLADMFFDLITVYSISPLRWITLFSFGAAAVAFVSTVVLAVYRVVVGEGVSGLVSTFAVLFLLLAVLLLVAAVLSEYLGRVYLEVRGRPYVLVAETVENR